MGCFISNDKPNVSKVVFCPPPACVHTRTYTTHKYLNFQKVNKIRSSPYVFFNHKFKSDAPVGVEAARVMLFKTKRQCLVIRSHTKLLRNVTTWLSCCGPVTLRSAPCLPTVPYDRQGQILFLVQAKHRASWSCIWDVHTGCGPEAPCFGASGKRRGQRLK